MAFTTFEFPDFSFLQQGVLNRVRQLQSLDRPLQRIRDDFYHIEEDWFATEGGGRWEPLSRWYSRWKGYYYPGKTILRRSDRMYNALTGKPGSHSIQQGTLRIYVVNADYWKAHQLGNPATHLPIRQVLSPMIQARAQTWHSWVTEWITRRLART